MGEADALHDLRSHYPRNGTIVGKSYLVWRLQDMGIPCSMWRLDRLIADNPHLRSTKRGQSLVYTPEEVAEYVKAATREYAKRLRALESPRPPKPASEKRVVHVQELGPLYAALAFNTATRRHTLIAGPEGLFETNDKETARRWPAESLPGSDGWLSLYTRALAVDSRFALRSRISRPKLVRWELPPLLAFYESLEGSLIPIRIPSHVSGVHVHEGDVAAVVAINDPHRIDVARFVERNCGWCQSIIWTRAVRLRVGTLVPDPRSRLQHQIVAELKRTNSAAIG